MKRVLPIFLAVLLLLGSCGNGGKNKKEDQTTEDPFNNIVIDYEYKTVNFEENNSLCVDDEGKGWVLLEEPLYGGLPSLGYEGNLPEVKAVSLSTAWSCVEQTPGNLDWTILDETIAYWASQGKMINLRLCTDSLVLSQGVVNGCPEWLYHEPYNVPKVYNMFGTICTDLASETYQIELRRFLAEFAEHFTNENYPYRDAIEVVELRGYGEWGEWHSGWDTYESVEQRVQALRDTIDLWREAWGDKLLVISCTYEYFESMEGVINAETYEEFMYWMGYDYALQLDNISFRRDGIAFALWPYDARMATDYFYMNTGLPLFGEIGGGYHTHTDNDRYPLFEAMNEALHKWRVSYNTVISWVAQDFGRVLDNETELTDYFARMMGFRFVPNQVQYSAKVKAGDKLYLNTLWTNQAMGRAWKDADLSIYLEDLKGNIVYTGTDASFNPVSINGGEPHFFNLEYSLPTSLKNGIYTLKFAISDAGGNPMIEMPISGNDGTNRYYLGQIMVGDEAAKDLSEIDSLDANSTFTVSGNGKITSEAVNVDGSKAIVGSGSEMFAYGKKLENGKTYYISFDYKTNKDKNTIAITDNSRYIVGAYDLTNGTWGDAYEWLDVSNKLSHRSATINVPDDGNTYYAAFGAMNSAAEIAIDDISIVEANVVKSTFELNPDSYRSYEFDDGAYRLTGTTDKGWINELRLKERLEAHTTYMITFDAKVATDVVNGGFFYVALLDPNVDMNDKYKSIESFSSNRIGSFWLPTDYDYQKFSYVFNTENYGEGWELVFGIRNGGSVRIKNITITRIDSDSVITAENETIERNVIPNKNIDVDANGVVENFEASVFNGGCMYPGSATMGVIGKKYVISGNYSCYIENFNPNHSVYNNNVYVHTNLADMRFSANTTYKVRFKFMITEALRADEDSYFYCSLNGISEFRWHSDDYEVGEVYSVELECTTPNSMDYFFLWGVCKYGAIAIDDVTFEKLDAPTGQGPTVTKGHTYQITQEVLYKRVGE